MAGVHENMRPTRRSLSLSISLICTLAAALASSVVSTVPRVASARTSNTQAILQSAAAPPQSNAIAPNPSTPAPRVFHVTVVDSKENLVAGVRREELTALDDGERRE